MIGSISGSLADSLMMMSITTGTLEGTIFREVACLEAFPAQALITDHTIPLVDRFYSIALLWVTVILRTEWTFLSRS